MKIVEQVELQESSASGVTNRSKLNALLVWFELGIHSVVVAKSEQIVEFVQKKEIKSGIVHKG